MTAYELLLFNLLCILWSLGLHLVLPETNFTSCLTLVYLLFFFGFTLGLLGGNL